MEVNMNDKISEAAVKDILRNREKKINNIHKKMYALHKELGSTDDVLETAALPAIKSDGMPGARGTHQDLSDVYLSYQKQLISRNEEIRKIMWSLVEEEERISRVWACFYALDDPYYSILNSIYVENQLYQTVENDFEMSHKTFEKNRQHAVSLIIKFFESGESIADLMNRYRTTDTRKTSKTKGKKKKQSNGYNQMSFFPDESEDKGGSVI